MEIVQKIQILYLNDYIWQKKCQKGQKMTKKKPQIWLIMRHLKYINGYNLVSSNNFSTYFFPHGRGPFI